MSFILNIIKNRNFILLLSLLAGFLFSAPAVYIEKYAITILGVVTAFSVTGISFRVFTEYKSLIKFSLQSILLTYIIHSGLIILLAYFIFDDKLIFLGFVTIAATPPGVAVISFTTIFKGNQEFSIKGILGSYLFSLLLTPVILGFFAKEKNIDVMNILSLIIQTLVIPMLLSRFLLIGKMKRITAKIRGKIVNIGFALIIYIAIGLNKDAFFTDFKIIFLSASILFFVIFVIGTVYSKLFQNRINKDLLISTDLMLTIKSSGFSAATSLALFGVRASIPSAILSIFILLYLIFAGYKYKKQK